MIHRITKLIVALSLVAIVAGCHHNKVNNPIANVDSKQPDKVLFDRAMDAMKKGKYDVARITLQTLINTYPDSEFIARAKLAVGDSWYAEGTTASYQQAEVEYKDFITFFPQLPEAAEAQLKIANMHYKQMEKPDRDYTHAMRAEDEYRQLIQQWPENAKLVPEAKQRLREVQEVLAERQYRIGRFYYLRESYPAAVARLKSLTDTYPLYSQGDDALMMLGHSYEAEAALLRASKLPEAPKVRLIKQYDADAGKAYSRIIERYPTSDRAGDAKARLKELELPIPTPTPEAIAQYKAEEESRSEMGRFGKMMSTFHKAPDDLPRAAKVGDPPLVDPQQTSAPQLIHEANNAALGISDKGGNGTVTLEKASGSDATKSDPIPRSQAAPSSSPESSAPSPAASGGSSSDTGIGELTPNAGAGAQGNDAASGSSTTAASASGSNASSATTPPQAPAQVNEIHNGSSSDASSPSPTSNDQGSSSSKKKKKTGLRKVVPF
ncbi:MAG: outer membrane protein assembly factor BamD [Acidobacteria bacterium]|nr:MAG: outer membrane protein assembly factor BamD [Acidobacteriota bacterium]PYY16576.1 MAG: outer membrane protein assembly factor BamD [Acidobacteriota bacterium]